MGNNAIMRHLLWKDYKTILRLVQIVVGCVLGFNVLFWLLQPNSMLVQTCSMAVWFLAPCLVAFGAAATLVGTEEDDHTLDWLRTLPVSWQQIAMSKLLVAYAAVLITGTVSTIAFRLNNLNLDPQLMRVADSQFLIAVVLTCCLIVLLGFALAYTVRSALAGLLLLLPLYVGVMIGGTRLSVQLGLIDPGRSFDREGVLITGIIGTVIAFVVQHLLARRRLQSPVDGPESRLATAFKFTSAPRPVVQRIHSRPSETVSLLWQQCRQIGTSCIAMWVIAFILAVGHWTARRQYVDTGIVNPTLALLWMTPFFLFLFSSWFGAITFYGDNQHRRCAFFADRGISPTRIWWTRIVPTLIAFFLFLAITNLIWIILMSGSSWANEWKGGMPYMLLLSGILYAYGQLLSQCLDRPLMAFLASPVIAVFSLMPLQFFVDLPRNGIWALAVVIPILLWGSWRMTQGWLEHGNRTRQVLHAGSYIGIAVSTSCILIYAQHHFTIAIIATEIYAVTLGATP